MRVSDKKSLFATYQPDHVSCPKELIKKIYILVNRFQQIFLYFSSLFENSCEYSTIMFIGTIEFLIRNIKSNWDKKKKYPFASSKLTSINSSSTNKCKILEIDDEQLRFISYR